MDRETEGEVNDDILISWVGSDYSRKINAKIQNDFFGWSFDLSSTYSQSQSIVYDYWSDDMSAAPLFFKNHQTYYEMNSSLSALADDLTGTGIQSTTANSNQFQIGILYSAIRKVNVNSHFYSSINSSFGPINNYIVAFSKSWSSDTEDASTYARNTNPWSLPRNSSLEEAIKGMLQYFGQQYGEDPKQLVPEFFEELKFGRYSNPLTIAKDNLWHRNFNIQYLESE